MFKLASRAIVILIVSIYLSSHVNARGGWAMSSRNNIRKSYVYVWSEWPDPSTTPCKRSCLSNRGRKTFEKKCLQCESNEQLPAGGPNLSTCRPQRSHEMSASYKYRLRETQKCEGGMSGRKTKYLNCYEPENCRLPPRVSETKANQKKYSWYTGSWGNWTISDHTTCPAESLEADCPGLVIHKRRHCRQQANERFTNAGYRCPGEPDGNHTQAVTVKQCPCWDSWSDWTSCSVSCGRGHNTRSRQCKYDDDDHVCVGERKQTKKCLSVQCAQWASWKSWSKCAEVCGKKTIERYRGCSTSTGAELAVDLCIQQLSKNETGDRETTQCDSPVPCSSWSKWLAWSACSGGCKGGEKKRARQCKNPAPVLPNDQCKGDSEETTQCPPTTCYAWHEWGEWSSCSTSCGAGLNTKTHRCRIDDVSSRRARATDDDTWSGDLASGDLNMSGSGSGSGSESGSGSGDYGSAEEDIDPFVSDDKCEGSSNSTRPCPAVTQCASWSSWLPWSSCSASCDEGFMATSRKCIYPTPMLTNDTCIGETEGYKPCPNITACQESSRKLQMQQSIGEKRSVKPTLEVNDTIKNVQAETKVSKDVEEHAYDYNGFETY